MNRRLVLRALLLFLLLESAALTAVYWYFGHQRQGYLANEYTDLTSNYRSVLDTYEVLSKALFVEVLNRQPVIDLMSRAVDADVAQRGALRQELLQRVQPTYRTLQQYQLNQLHFHLPDLTSFLRLHRPAIYGDNLAVIRPAVMMANQRREYVSGFEVGRHEGGFRFIFPLFDRQRFIGTVETSLSYNNFYEQLRKRFPGDYALLIKKSVVEQRVVDQGKYNLTASPFSRQLMQERVGDHNQPSHVPLERIGIIAERLRPRIEQQISANRPVHLATSISGQSYAVLLIPMTNVAGQTESYLLKIDQDHNLEMLRLTCTVTALVMTLLVALLCSYLLSIARRSQTLKETNQLFHAAIDALPYPFQVIDTRNYKILVANNKTSLNGKPVEGLTCYSVSHGASAPCDDPQHPCPLTLALQQRQTVVVEHIHRNQDGEERVVEVHGHPIVDADGEIRQCIEYVIDVTERKELQKQLIQLAETDALTGAWNRRKFYDLVETELRRAVRYERPVTLLMLDVDHFKQINDTHGHDVGDSVLKELVLLLRSQLRINDLLARSGGEEFLILAPETGLDKARLLAEKLVQSVRNHRFSGIEAVRISVGIAAYQPNDTIDQLVKRADQALYRAKSRGRDRWET